MDFMVPEAPNFNRRIMGYTIWLQHINLDKKWLKVMLHFFLVVVFLIFFLNLQAATPNGSHLASTYCALAILKTVGYDLSLMDSKLLLNSMKNLQQPDGWY